MSNTIAHRPHVHHHQASLTSLFAVLAAVAVAALVIWAVNQPQTETIATTGGTTVAAPVVQPLEVPVPRSEITRHTEMRVLLRGEPAQYYLAGSLHRIEGTTLDQVGAAPYTAPAVREFGRSKSVRCPSRVRARSP